MSSKREVKSVKLKGLNSVDSIHAVVDGWCGTAHNVSFRDSEVKSQCGHHKDVVLAMGDYTVKYIHSILPAREYIALSGLDLCHVKEVDGTLFLLKNIMNFDFGTDMDSISFSSFSDTLYVNYITGGMTFSKSYTYHDKQYFPHIMNDVREIPEPEISMKYFKPKKLNDADPAMSVALVHTAKLEGTEQYYAVSTDKQYESIYADITKANYLYGAVYLMFAIKMRDGAIMYNSKIYMLTGEYDRDNSTNTLYRVARFNTSGQASFFKDIYGFQPTIKFVGLEYLKNNDQVQSIIIYSTRNTPIHNFDNIYYDFPVSPNDYETTAIGLMYTASSCHVFDKRNLDVVNTPFYQIAEVDFRVKDSITLGASDSYVDIEKKPIYSPTVSPHSYSPEGSFNLNGRKHQFNITTQLYQAASQVINQAEIVVKGVNYVRQYSSNNSDLQTINFAVTLNVLGELHVVISSYKGYYYTEHGSGNRYLIIPNMLSYPDVRAQKIDIYISYLAAGQQEYTLIKSVKLKPAIANNYAVYYNTSGDALMYCEVIKYGSLPQNNYTPEEGNNFCRFKNQIMVSEYNKPYQFYPKHIYYVGDNVTTEIVDANTPTDQLTESRFGQYPLYLFTSTGIYAMEQGVDSVLYQNIIKVNDDIAAHNSNTVSAEGALFYFTDNGLMSLRGRVSGIVSQKLDDRIAKFLNGATISYIPIYREILISNRLFDYAYIYSFNSGDWTTRDFKGAILSYSKYIEDNIIYDYLNAEDDNYPLNATIVTRELSLNNHFLKRLEVLKIDIITSNDYKVTILSSSDGKEWFELLKSENSAYLRRTLSSWRWFKVMIEGKKFRIDSLHFESFIRFARHIK